MKTRDFYSKTEFTNAGQLSVFFLGTGSAFTKLNFQNNILIIKGEDHVLVDCGSLCPLAFADFVSISCFLTSGSLSARCKRFVSFSPI